MNNLAQIRRLPHWCTYIFSVLKHVRSSNPELLQSLWDQLQTLLLAIVMSPLENKMYREKDGSGMKTTMAEMYEVFGAIREFDKDTPRPHAYEHGLLGEFFVLVTNRLVTLLGMPGEKVGERGGLLRRRCLSRKLRTTSTPSRTF